MQKRILFVLFTFINLSLMFGQTSTAPSGSGSEGDPYLISSIDNLYWLTQNSSEWGNYFKQTQNIVASSTSGWDSNSGFTPIGTSVNYFTGEYDGNGFTIDGLTISRTTTDYVGLFGYAKVATIKNVKVTNVNITGQDKVGGVIGYYYNATSGTSTTISNCSSTGNVSGRQYVGGLIGYQKSSTDGTTVENCYSTCNVSGTVSSIGGLIGENYGNTTLVSSCYSKGDVSGVDYVGGLIGYAFKTQSTTGVIENCYSMGNVTSTSGTSVKIAPFCGFNDDVSIKYSYSTGSVTYATGSTTTHGFIGTDNNSPYYWDNFFDSQVSNQTSSTGATAKTTVQMKTEATFTEATSPGWDFTNTWEIVGGNGANYPRLKTNIDATLPVELTSFTATSTSSATVVLNWTTATEVNNYGFDVESKRASTDDWTIIGFVEGHGNSNSPKNYSFVVSTSSENDISFRLKQIDTDGAFEYSDVVTVEMELLKDFELVQNYPNPFNPTTSISFTLPSNGFVTLKVYNIIGEEVSKLINNKMDAGRHKVEFNATNLPSGTYFYRITTDNFSDTKKMLLIK